MVLNLVWIAFILVGFVVALVRLALVRWRTDWRLREDAPRCVYPS